MHRLAPRRRTMPENTMPERTAPINPAPDHARMPAIGVIDHQMTGAIPHCRGGRRPLLYDLLHDLLLLHGRGLQIIGKLTELSFQILRGAIEHCRVPLGAMLHAGGRDAMRHLLDR